MVIILDKVYMNYQDAFRNIFEGDMLAKKFPNWVETVCRNKMWAIVCLFCPFVALNDGYAYKHLATSHLNILWGCGECFNYAHNNLSSFHMHIKDKHSKNLTRKTREVWAERMNQRIRKMSPKTRAWALGALQDLKILDRRVKMMKAMKEIHLTKDLPQNANLV